MIKLSPKFVTNDVGEKLVILTADEFEAIMEELEDNYDVSLFDEAKKADDGFRKTLEDYLRSRQS